jgi:hypothetical protein
MINTETHEYTHVHPVTDYEADFLGKAGPKLQFYVVPISGTFAPGIYKLYGQFKRNGTVFVAEYTIRLTQ